MSEKSNPTPRPPQGNSEPKAAEPAPAKSEREPVLMGRSGPEIDVNRIRTIVARVVWAICVICALILAGAALLVALKANEQNGLVQFVLDSADNVDLGVFTVENGIKEFVGKHSDIKNALLNWGLGAIAWIVIGRVLERVIRP